MGGIKTRITTNIFFYRTNKITPNILLLKYNKNKGRKNKRGKKHKRRKKMRGGKKEKKR